jgi:hypothetical protein
MFYGFIAYIVEFFLLVGVHINNFQDTEVSTMSEQFFRVSFVLKNTTLGQLFNSNTPPKLRDIWFWYGISLCII